MLFPGVLPVNFRPSFAKELKHGSKSLWSVACCKSLTEKSMSSALTIRVDRDVWRTRSLSLWSDVLTLVIFCIAAGGFCWPDVRFTNLSLASASCVSLDISFEGFAVDGAGGGSRRYHQRHSCPTFSSFVLSLLPSFFFSQHSRFHTTITNISI